jgi:hypothetical protein
MWPSSVSRNADEAARAGSSHGEEGSMNSATHIHLERRPSKASPRNPRPVEVTNTSDSNRAAIRDFYDLAFNQRQPVEAVAKYVGNYYRQHHPAAADGREAFV